MAIRVFVYAGLTVVVVGYALLRGGRTERLGALIWLLGYVTSFAAVSRPLPPGAVSALPLIDLAVLAGFVALAVWDRPFWLRWALALQLLTVATHVVVALAPEVERWAYRIFIYGAAWPIVVLLAVGTRAQAVRRNAASARLSSHT